MIAYLNSHPHLAEILRGGGLSLLLKAVGAILGFILTLAIARLLGAEETGHYFLALSVVTLLAVLVRAGFDRLVIRRVAAASATVDWSQINSLYISVMRCVAIISLIMVIILFWAGDWLTASIFNKPGLAPVWAWLVWSIFPFALYFLHGQFFQGIKKISGAMFAQGLGLPLFLLLLVVAVWIIGINITASLLAALYVLASFFVLLVLLIFWWKNPEVHLAPPTSLHELAPAALPLWGVQLLGQVLQWSAPIFLGVYAMSSDVAIFSVAYRTALLTSIVLMAVNSIAAPKFAAQYHQKDMRGLHQVAIWSTRLMLIVSLPLLGFLLLFPEWIMGSFGSEFVAGSSVLTVLALGQFVNVFTGSVGFLLSMTGHERDLLKSTVIAAILMLVLCAWLIPVYGMMGAAIAQSTSLSVQMFINSWFVKRALGFVPMNVFARV
jgi:O-antigen/teichoic acid export membrane protein